MTFSVEQHRQYQKKRRLERLVLAKERLGGQCVRCGSTEDLQFDHVKPGSKARKVSEATNWSMERFLAEVDKCQLLCFEHHILKSQESGELSGSRKLTAEDVRKIRDSELTNGELATRFKVSPSAIGKIRTRKTWQLLP